MHRTEVQTWMWQLCKGMAWTGRKGSPWPGWNPLSEALGFWYKPAMPTVFRFDGLRVIIYPNDHRPAHVHVKGGVGEAVFILHCPDGPPALRESFGFNTPELNRIGAELASVLATMCAEWRTIHGRY